jgi:hypothetical protein
VGVEFDGEGYLRALGRQLRGKRDLDSALDGLTEVARALVAAGLLDDDVAQDALDDFEVATTVRNRQRWPTSMRARRARVRDAPRQVLPVRALRIARCDHRLKRDQGTLRIRQIQLAQDESSAVVDFVVRPGGPVLTDRTGRTRPEPVQVAITDDRGTETIGWCGGPSRTGEMSIRGVLSVDTAWLEFDGERCELVDAALAATVISAAPIDDRHPGLGHLWYRVALHSDYGSPHRHWRLAVDAMQAAGVVSDSDAAEIRAVRALLDTLQHGAETADIRAVRELLDGIQAPPQAPDGCPEPWRSMLIRRGSTDGPTAEILVNATIPPIDGISIAIRTIDSRASDFTIAVEVTPSLGSLTPYAWQQGERLAWWASDNLGNRYLGQTRQWVSHDHAGSEDDSHGTVTFWPPLDPKAGRLDIMPTVEAARAVLSITLPVMAVPTVP